MFSESVFVICQNKADYLILQPRIHFLLLTRCFCCLNMNTDGTVDAKPIVWCDSCIPTPHPKQLLTLLLLINGALNSFKNRTSPSQLNWESSLAVYEHICKIWAAWTNCSHTTGSVKLRHCGPLSWMLNSACYILTVLTCSALLQDNAGHFLYLIQLKYLIWAFVCAIKLNYCSKTFEQTWVNHNTALDDRFHP